MRRPRIGLCGTIEQAQTGPWRETYDQLPRSYSESVQRAGGLALLLPADAGHVQDPDEALAPIDALVLTGGSDIDPASYGEPPHPATEPSAKPRDEAELALARRAIALDLPLLGICRGMQLLNVARGGTLVQDLPESIGHSGHRSTPGQFDRHEVRLAAGSLVARAAGDQTQQVNSHHHQGVERLGEGLVATGWSGDDGLVEAIELPDRRFVLGVLWHPEEDRESSLIRALVEQARDSKAGRPRK